MSDEKDIAIATAAAREFLANAVKITGVKSSVTGNVSVPEDAPQNPPSVPDRKPG